MIDRMRHLLSLVLGVAGCGAAAAQTDGPTLADWPHYGGTQLSWRYSALDQVNTNNVKNLAPAWIFQTGDYAENLQSTPIVVDGVMYLITPRARVFALDAATGRLIWQYNYSASRGAVPGSEGTFVQNRGLAVSAGMVLFGTVDNHVVALDSKTGREAWKVAVDDPRQCGCNIGAAPLVAKDKVIVGGNNGDGAHRGYLTAFYVKTGTARLALVCGARSGREGSRDMEGRQLEVRRRRSLADRIVRSRLEPGLLGHRQCGQRLLRPAGALRARTRAKTSTSTPRAWWRSMRIQASCAGTIRKCRTMSGISIRPTNPS